MVLGPEEEEVPSSTSDLEEEREDADLQAATQRLTQDFLSQVIQEEEGQEKRTLEVVYDQEVAPEEGAGLRPQVPSLASILGRLPSAASLGLHETFNTFDESEPSEKPDGERKTSHQILSTPNNQ